MWETVIGVEVHARIKTKTKMFCNCDNNTFGKSPNSQICPVCSGFPGALPVANSEAIRLGILTSLALNCQISKNSNFDRKSYFYPDLPSGYQISQFDKPIGKNGEIEISGKFGQKKIRINRLHLENDAGKLTHTEGKTLVDLNRAGSPLFEIVTEADFRSAEEVGVFLRELQKILRFLESSDADMEKGQMRCDANVSLRKKGKKKFGTRTEIKNLNSFSNTEKAIEFEVLRQKKILESGAKVRQQTRGFSIDSGKTFLQREKEESEDYRYFSDPDLPPLKISDQEIHTIKKNLPELPAARKKRFINDFGILENLAEILSSEKDWANFFEKVVQISKLPKIAANWICGDFRKILNEKSQNLAEINFNPENLSKFLQLINSGKISGKIGKEIFPEILEKNLDPEKFIQEKNLLQISDAEEIEKIAREICKNNQKIVEDIRSGKDKAIGALIGQMMKKTTGKINPAVANKVLRKVLGSR